MSDEPLKDCPFCGGRAICWKDDNNSPVTFNVTCEFCRCGTEKAEYLNRETAIQVWNNRPTIKPSEPVAGMNEPSKIALDCAEKVSKEFKYDTRTGTKHFDFNAAAVYIQKAIADAVATHEKPISGEAITWIKRAQDRLDRNDQTKNDAWKFLNEALYLLAPKPEKLK